MPDDEMNRHICKTILQRDIPLSVEQVIKQKKIDVECKNGKARKKLNFLLPNVDFELLTKKRV
jgi:hypothetical protein